VKKSVDELAFAESVEGDATGGRERADRYGLVRPLQLEALLMPGADEFAPPQHDNQTGFSTGTQGDVRCVAGYRLLRQVGEGGMSTVYLSYDVPGRRAVAVKLLANHLAGQREFVSRFYREARFSRLLQHPNVVRGYTAGYDPDVNKHYLVLEFIDGPSAHKAMTRLGRLPVGVAVRIGIDIARALDFLHRRNYVHRDVKPDNILLDPDAGAKIADLGLTKRLGDDTHLTSINQGVGTSYYMPYEQAMNAALVDGRSDIFALGATLYHLLSGEVPFQGSTHEEIIRGKQHNSFVPLRQLNPDVPELLERIIAATLARDPRARYQEAGRLADDLEATGLAAPIADFVTADNPEIPTEKEVAVIEAPTRADLPARSGVLPPDVVPAVPPAATPIPPDGSSTPLASVVVTAILLALGVVNASAQPSESLLSTPPKDTTVHEQHAVPPVDLCPVEPQ
jgi:serine/threonine-protein kinase